MTREELKQQLLSTPEKMLRKKPFTRGCDNGYGSRSYNPVEISGDIEVRLPKFRRKVVTQEQFMRELDPACHLCLFDDNIPSITMKLQDGGWADIRFEKMSLPIQQLIKNKQVLHLTGYPMDFTLMHTDPDDTIRKNFIVFKQYWDKRNQDGMKNKMVDVQKSYGDAGLLYYFDHKGRIKSRILSFADGYVLCPHNDDNGDRLIEAVYYSSEGIENIDAYDDTYVYHYECDGNIIASGDEFTSWRLVSKTAHGFEEIPLITKRGDVAWNNVQSIIESKEILYNVFNVIQKRFGWGILYVKGRFKDEGKKIAGNVVLNDSSMDNSNSDAKFLTPPSPEGIIQTLDSLDEEIQKGSSTTFLLPKDIKSTGDVSGIAVQLTQSMDIENALRGVIEWQNVADKMVRLFKYGLAKELVNSGENPFAITEFEKLNIGAKYKVWRPFSDYEYNHMLCEMRSNGIISTETGVEVNTISKPDEVARIKREYDDKIQKEIDAERMKAVAEQESNENQNIEIEENGEDA